MDIFRTVVIKATKLLGWKKTQSEIDNNNEENIDNHRIVAMKSIKL